LSIVFVTVALDRGNTDIGTVIMDYNVTEC